MRARRPVLLRTVTLCALWVAGAVGATLVGLTAIGAIGSGIGAPGPAPLDRAQVDSRLASAPQPPLPAPTSATAPATLDPAAAQVLTVASGGTVVASCPGGVPRILTISPAQGFQASSKSDEDGPKVKFESDAVDFTGVLSCGAGHPTVAVQVKNND